MDESVNGGDNAAAKGHDKAESADNDREASPKGDEVPSGQNDDKASTVAEMVEGGEGRVQGDQNIAGTVEWSEIGRKFKIKHNNFIFLWIQQI